MNKTEYISLTEFMDYVNTSGSAKATVVTQAKRKREEGHTKTADYWMQLRNAIRSVHWKFRRKLTHVVRFESDPPFRWKVTRWS